MLRQDGQRIRHELDKLTENAERREVDIDTLTGRSGCRLRVGGMRIIFERLVGADAETMLSDEELYDLATAADEESFPAEVVDQLLAGRNPIGVFRRHRGMRQRHLAGAVGINRVYLSQIVKRRAHRLDQDAAGNRQGAPRPIWTT